MLKGRVIMDVTNAEQVRIAETAAARDGNVRTDQSTDSGGMPVLGTCAGMILLCRLLRR